MDVSSPEFVAGRAVAVFAIERFIRDRTALLMWGVVALAGLLVVGTILSDGLGAILLGLVALIAVAVAATLFVVRAAVLRGLRRVGGGPDYARIRPIVARRMAELDSAHEVISLDPVGIARLAWLARRPADLQQHVRETAAKVARTIPEVVADVRRELARPTG